MNLTSRMTRPVTITTPGQPTGDIDAYGNPVLGNPTVVEELSYLEQTSTTEETVGQQTASGVWWAALFPDTIAGATSTLHYPDSGQTFHVAGEPATRFDPWEKVPVFVRVELETETA